MVLSVFAIRAGVEIKLMPIRSEHLSYGVFHYHSFVNIKFIKENGAVQLVFRKGTIHKRMSYKKTCICHIAFLRRVIGAERKSDVRIGCVEAVVDDHSLV